MEQPAFHFDDAEFTYAVAPKPLVRFSRHIPVMDGALVISHTSKTRVVTAKTGDREIAVIGFCVDAHGEVERDEIPAFLLDQTERDIAPVYRFCDRFAGHYVVLYQNGSKRYVFGDATGSVQVNYSFHEGSLCFSSVDRLVADQFGFQLSAYSLKIRRGATGLSQALPYDVTMFDEVKALLPNHYLDITENRPLRMAVSADIAAYAASSEETVQASAALIQRTVREYWKYYDIVCPLTSGYDSRVVFSFLRNARENLSCYTFHHAHFTEKTADLWVPKQICKDFGAPYTVVKDLQTPDEYTQAVCCTIGRYHSTETIDLAYTFKITFPGKAVVNGDIIGQVGKSSLMRDVPSCLANSLFFLAKTHNKERLALRETKKYVSEIRAVGDAAYLFDLFATENRMGRWASQGRMIDSVCSTVSLNIFNCRELILRWMGVPRKLRTAQFLHRSFLAEDNPRLLEYPFNPDEQYTFFKKNWLIFYLASYIKLLLSKPARLPKAEDL